MKIFFNRIPKDSPYGGGNQFLKSMVDHLVEKGHHVTFSLEKDLDVIFLMDPRPTEPQFISINEIINYKAGNPKTKILHRVNECDSRKNTNSMDPLLLKTMTHVDHVVFISKWLQEYFKDLGFVAPSSVIYNGCDTNIFSPPVDTRDSDKKIRVVTHHWSDNWMKGFDIYTQIDRFLCENDDFEFTYIGRYNSLYTPKRTNVVQPLHGLKLANELRNHDVYVTASRNEPCGMHHIEGAASGLPTLFHKDGGGINEFASRHGLEYTDFQDFLEKLSLIRVNLDNFKSKIDYNELSIFKCCQKFEDKIYEMLGK